MEMLFILMSAITPESEILTELKEAINRYESKISSANGAEGEEEDLQKLKMDILYYSEMFMLKQTTEVRIMSDERDDYLDHLKNAIRGGKKPSKPETKDGTDKN